MLNYEYYNAVTPGDGTHLARGRPQFGDGAGFDGISGDVAQLTEMDAPAALPIIDNTCYFNSLLQGFKQMLLRMLSAHWPPQPTRFDTKLSQRNRGDNDIA